MAASALCSDQTATSHLPWDLETLSGRFHQGWDVDVGHDLRCYCADAGLVGLRGAGELAAGQARPAHGGALQSAGGAGGPAGVGEKSGRPGLSVARLGRSANGMNRANNQG